MQTTRDRTNLRDRLPALRRLETRPPGGALPFVQQLNATDCGAACLAMVLRFLQVDVSPDDVRDRLGSSRDGVSARALLEVGHSFGLRGRAIALEIEDLRLLGRGAVLHWRMSHFVVLDRVRGGRVEILDPEFGRRRLTLEDADRAFTGVALLFEAGRRLRREPARPSPIRHYLRTVLAHSSVLTRVLVTSLAGQAIGLALPIVTGVVVDRVVPRRDPDLLVAVGGGIVMIVLTGFLVTFLRSHLLLQLRTNLDVQFTADFVEHLLRLPFSFFQLRGPGDLVERLSSNNMIRETLTASMLSGLLDGILVVAYLLVLFLTHPGLGLLVLGLGSLRLLVFLGTRRRHRELLSEDLRTGADVANQQVQMLGGIELIKSSGAEMRALEEWSSAFVESMNTTLARARLDALVQSLLSVLSTASPLLVLSFGAHLVLEDEISLGTMLAMGALANGFLGPLSSLIQIGFSLETLGGYVERVGEVLRHKPESDGSGTRMAPDLAGRIELRNVSFRYSPHGAWALEDVAVDIPAGSTVALVGRSGSGKSTLARLLVGLYRPTSGRVLFDGHDLAGLDLQSVRRQIGFVQQSPYLFATTLRRNITYADPSRSLEDVRHAARLAHVDHEIEAMPLGYDTPVAAGGTSISGGQAQRIALARALVHRPSILVLDEASSHLDSVAEARVHANLATLGCTRIVIAHRMSTVRDADLILVMDEGRIVEQGTHESLLLRGGTYATLVRGQWKGEHPHVSVER